MAVRILMAVLIAGMVAFIAEPPGYKGWRGWFVFWIIFRGLVWWWCVR